MMTDTISWLMIVLPPLLPVLLLTVMVLLERRHRSVPSTIPLDHGRAGVERRHKPAR